MCCIKPLPPRLGCAFINKRFHISNQSLFSEEAIPPPPSLTLLPFPHPSQQAAQTGNDWKQRIYDVLLVLGLPSATGANHAPEHVRNSTQIRVSGNRVPASLPVAPDTALTVMS